MDAVNNFFYMGGYALYVWGSFGVTALFMLAEPLILRHHRRQELRRILRLRQLQAKTGESS
jgi:heme exporter protein D